MSAVTDLLAAHGWTVYLVVALPVFAEDALFVGFVIPGETAAVLGGVAASLSHVGLVPIIAMVVAAALVGDSVGFEVGRKFGPRLLHSPRLARHQSRIARAENLLHRHGAIAVFLARFVAFLRAVVPALAGSAQIPYRRFLPWNAIGGLVWGVLFTSLGLLLVRPTRQWNAISLAIC